MQPGKTGFAPFLILAIVGAVALWTLRDSWADWLAVPYSTDPREASKPPVGETSVPVARSARSIAGLISGDDYPADAQRNDEQGTVRVELKIDEQGRVSRCDVVEGSGSHSLDSATCRILQNRARFSPARDSAGRPIGDTYRQSITWRLEG